MLPRPRCLPLAAFLILFSSMLLTAADVAPVQPSQKDRCAACGMAVTPHPAWLAEIVYRDGSADFFDGPKCLFKAMKGLSKKKHAVRESEIAALFVTTYYEGEAIRAEEAWYVFGSDVRGPMGNELVPHASQEEAREFLRDHAGKGIVRFGEISIELLKSL